MEGPHGGYGREPPEAYAWWSGWMVGFVTGGLVVGAFWILVSLGIIGWT